MLTDVLGKEIKEGEYVAYGIERDQGIVIGKVVEILHDETTVGFGREGRKVIYRYALKIKPYMQSRWMNWDTGIPREPEKREARTVVVSNIQKVLVLNKEDVKERLAAMGISEGPE